MVSGISWWTGYVMHLSIFALIGRFNRCGAFAPIVRRRVGVGASHYALVLRLGRYRHTSWRMSISSQRVDDDFGNASLGKKAARKKSKEEEKQRNLMLKELLSKESRNGSGGYIVPTLYAIKVSVCPELRTELNMNGREKRGRMFIELGSEGTKSLKGLRCELHSFFRSLRKSTFVLSAALPEVDEDGSLLAPVDEDGYNVYPGKLSYWNITSDMDVEKTFKEALKHKSNHALMKRPSVMVHVEKDPNAPPPPPPPSYLEDMADPSQTDTMTMLSFYAFPPPIEGKPFGIEDPDEFALKIRKLWKPFNALGRVYVAGEGVNAQMAIPSNVMPNFIECCNSIPELGVHVENGINIDPIPLSMEEFSFAGDPESDTPSPPFKNLHVRIRKQVVADGLDYSLDWQTAGYDMPPLEWHENVKKLSSLDVEDADKPILLDCRNSYETEVGKFVGAEPLKTETFRESWDVLKDRLADTPKDAPIMTYCTGGIRCVKVGAYLTQELGFTNVSRLAGGIVAYDRTISEKKDEKPLFEGTNYVFDGRVGRAITDNKMGTCITCGAKTNLLTNCANTACHKRMVQCEKCRPKYLGTCSDACKQRVINSAKGSLQTSPESVNWQQQSQKFENVDDYSSAYSSTPPPLFREIEENTKFFSPEGAHMISGSSQGRLLTSLASMTRSGRVLEIGSYTGYATCCFLEGVTNAAEAINFPDVGNKQQGPYVLSLERDQRAIDIAAAHIEIMAKFGIQREGAAESSSLRKVDFEKYIEELWKRHDNTNKRTLNVEYRDASSCELMKVDDALATIEYMSTGNAEISPFDLVFIDADKTRLLDYVEACLSTDSVLKKGGIILVDNVLWKGGVLEVAAGEEERDSVEMTAVEMKCSRRARKLASAMHTFNNAIIQDKRVEVVMLPLRDGLTMIRKR